MSVARRVVIIAGLFGCGFAVTWFVSEPTQPQDAELVSAARTAEPRGEAARMALPAVPTTTFVTPTLSFNQRLIADDRVSGVATLALIERTVRDLVDVRMKAGLAEREPRMPRDCFAGDLPAPVAWQVEVAVEIERVTVSAYRVTSANLPEAVVACLEDYFAGQATTDAPPGYPPLRATETIFTGRDSYLVSGREAAARLDGGVTSSPSRR